MKKQIGIRINKITEGQIEELRVKLEMQQTEVIATAVNEFYQKMKPKLKAIVPKDPAE